MKDYVQFFITIITLFIMMLAIGIKQGDPDQELMLSSSTKITTNKVCFGDWPSTYTCEEYNVSIFQKERRD